jgi:AcrR family transcriptional regulator
MPKVVDAAARRQSVVDAVFRVINQQGLEQASLRNVADEAGLAIGSIRHYFNSQPELMAFAMRALVHRVAARMLSQADRLSDPAELSATRRRAVTEEVLAELLPLDDERRHESAIRLAFTTAARTRPELRSCLYELYDGQRATVAQILIGAQRAGSLLAALDIRLETERLCALLDGLTLDVVLWPDRMDRGGMIAVLRRHLDGLVPVTATD